MDPLIQRVWRDLKKPVLHGMQKFSMPSQNDGTPFLTGRINVEVASQILGFNQDEITILMGKGHIKPLGSPKQNSPKWFAAVTILEHAHDPQWLDKATGAVQKTWRAKRARAKTAK
jgi:hypothetical protein